MMHSVTFAFLAAHMMTIVTLSLGNYSIFLNTYTDTDSVDIFDSKVQALTDLRLVTVRFIYLFAMIPSMNLKLVMLYMAMIRGFITKLFTGMMDHIHWLNKCILLNNVE